VISAYFNVMIYIEFKLLNYYLVYFVNWIFLFKIYLLFGKFAHLLLVCTRKLFFSSTGFIVVSLHNLKNKTILTLPKGLTIYKTLIFVLDLPIIITFTKKNFENILCC